MLPFLRPLAKRTPHWLLNLDPGAIEQGPGRWMDHLVKDALVYPGSGLDGSPVRQFNGVIHSYIFADYGIARQELVEQLRRPRTTGTGFAHHDLVALAEFDPAPLIRGAHPAFIHEPSAFARSGPPLGIWAVYQGNEGSRARFSFLFLGVEAIQALAALFPERAPRALLIQEHGFGGNCWGNFSDPVFGLAGRWGGPPEILILGPNHHLDAWRRSGRSLGTDLATESMHRNVREIIWSGRTGARGCRADETLVEPFA